MDLNKNLSTQLLPYDCFLERKKISIIVKKCYKICACAANIIFVGREGCAQIDHIYSRIWLNLA